MACYFEKISTYKEQESIELPIRKTKHSAGYDIAAAEDTVVPSHYKNLLKMVWEHIQEDEFLELVSESKLAMAIGMGVKDPDRLTPYFMELAPQLSNFFTMDLGGMKSLVKEHKLGATLVPTGIKAYMNENQLLELNIRSSVSLNNCLVLANGTGIIDSDYVDNLDNEGHIFFQFINLSPFDILIRKGDIIGQGIFKTFDITADDNADGLRTGGHGSTSKI